MSRFGSVRNLMRSLSRSSSTRSTRSTVSTSTFVSTATTSTAPPAGSPISLKGEVEISEVRAKDKKEVLVMASLKAPVFEQNEEDKRAPIDLCCILDRSGSMAGEKLRTVKQAMMFVLDNLTAADSLSVVLYDTRVDVLFKFTRMDDKEKKRVRELIDKVETADMTNLSGGLFQGVELAEGRSKPNDVCSLLLFTDGLANHGVTVTSEITAQLEKKLTRFSKKPTVFTFGFGDDHNADMLRGIAEAGGGMFYYVSETDKIALAFADCLGGLQSVVGQNLVLEVAAHEGAKIVKSLNPKYKLIKGGSLPSKKISVELGDIYSEEGRDLLFLVELPSLSSPAPDPVHYVTFSLSYFNVLKLADEQSEAEVAVRRPEAAAKDQAPNLELDKQRNRIEAAEAMRIARETANKGKLDDAKKGLQEAMQQVKTSASGSDTFCQNLVKDLEQCLGEMRDDDYYRSSGSKMISKKEMSHYNQRSNMMYESEVGFYETSSKVASKSRSSNYH